MKLPLFVIRILNPVVSAVLRSPLHGLMSRDTMLISFTGRRSGKTYTTPVSYSRDGDVVNVFTIAPWWRNLLVNQQVTLQLAGETRTGRAQTTRDDTECVKRAIREFLERVPRDRVYFNHGSDGDVDGTQTMEDMTLPVVLIEIHLDKGN